MYMSEAGLHTSFGRSNNAVALKTLPFVWCCDVADHDLTQGTIDVWDWQVVFY